MNCESGLLVEFCAIVLCDRIFKAQFPELEDSRLCHRHDRFLLLLPNWAQNSAPMVILTLASSQKLKNVRIHVRFERILLGLPSKAGQFES